MKRLALLTLLLASPALAQQQPDPIFMQRAIAQLQAQRNQAMDAAALAETKAAGMAEEIDKLKAQLAAATKKDEPK